MQQVHLDNLAKLRDFLMTNDVGFNMRVYRENNGGISKAQIEDGPAACGTAACAMGWAPFLFDVPEDMWNDDGIFTSYSDLSDHLFDVDFGDGVWDWLFGFPWYQYDNTRQGAAYRIDQYMQGKSSKDFFFSCDGLPEEFDLEQYRADRDEWIAKYHATKAD